MILPHAGRPALPGPPQPVDLAPPEPFSVGEWLVDAQRNRLRCGREEVKLQPKLMDVLVYLAERSHQVVSREELEASVWTGTVVGYDTVTGAIHKLRHVLQDDRRQPRYIETVSKRGYRFVAPVRRSPPASGLPERRSPQRDDRQARCVWRHVSRRTFLRCGMLMRGLSAAALTISHRWEPKTLSVVQTPAATVVVRPFSSICGDGREPLDAALSDELVTGLARLPPITVTLDSTPPPFAQAETGERSLTRETPSRYLLCGSIRWLDDAHVRINARLIDRSRDVLLWAHSYESDVGNVIAVSNQITADLMTTLAIRLSPGMQQDLGPPITTNPCAYDEFLIGRLRFYQYATREQNDRARDHFRSALRHDPSFAMAAAMLGWTYVIDTMNGWTTNCEENLLLALDYLADAARVDDSLSLAFFVRGIAFRELGSLAEAMMQAEKLLLVDPGYPNGHLLMGTVLARDGHPEAGLAHVQTAVALYPDHPSNYYLPLGQAYYLCGRYAEATNAFRQGRARHPMSEQTGLWLAASLAATGKIEDARRILLEIPGFSVADLTTNLACNDQALYSVLTEQLRQL